MNLEQKGEPWSERLLLAPVWGVHWRSRIREAESSAHYCLPSSPFLFLLCAQELRLLAAVPAEPSESRAPPARLRSVTGSEGPEYGAWMEEAQELFAV